MAAGATRGVAGFGATLSPAGSTCPHRCEGNCDRSRHPSVLVAKPSENRKGDDSAVAMRDRRPDPHALSQCLMWPGVIEVPNVLGEDRE